MCDMYCQTKFVWLALLLCPLLFTDILLHFLEKKLCKTLYGSIGDFHFFVLLSYLVEGIRGTCFYY